MDVNTSSGVGERVSNNRQVYVGVSMSVGWMCVCPGGMTVVVG